MSNFKQRRRNYIIAILITTLIGLSLVVLISYYLTNLETIPYSKRTHFVPMSRESEKIMGDRDFNLYMVENTGKILPNEHPMSKRAAYVVANMVKALRRGLRDDPSYLDHVHWEVIVVNNPNINGHCFLGGEIVLSTGLLEYYKSDAQIAFIIGHEIAHDLARHGAELAFKDHFGGLFSLFSLRQMEYEADHIGLLLMASAGYDPSAALRMMARDALMFKGDEPKDHSIWKMVKRKALEYADTHPSLKNRFRFIDQAQEEALDLYFNEN